MTSVAAPPPELWSVVADVPGWAGVLPEVEVAEQVDGAPGRGAVYRIVRAGRADRWECTDLLPGRSMTLVRRARGHRTVSTYEVQVRGGGQSRLAMTLGWFGPLRVVRELREVAGAGARLRAEAEALATAAARRR